MREELHGMLRRMADAGAFEETRPEDIAFSLSLPAERSVDLGLVLDTRADPARGLAVLATAPGGAAQQLGLAAGDVIAAVDGRSLAGDGAAAAATLRAAAAAARDGDELRLRVLRDDRTLELVGPVHAQYLPALRLELGEGALVASNAPVALAPAAAAARRGAGRAPTPAAASAPSTSRRASNASTARGCCRSTASCRARRGRRPTGSSRVRHVLEISEDIDTQDLPDYFSRLRPRFGRQVLEVEVEAGMTALVAARLLDDVPAKGRPYWEPTVWKSIAEPCR